MTTKISTQKELDDALAAGLTDFEFVAAGTFEIGAKIPFIKAHVEFALQWNILLKFLGSSSAELWGSSRAELWGSSRAELWGSSRAVLRESSSAVLRESSRAVLRESSSAVAKGFCSLHLWGAAKAVLSLKCHVHIHSKKATAKGGIQTEAFIDTAKEWCEYHGVEIKHGMAVLFKAVREDFGSHHNPNFKYLPGTSPEADGWDTQECSKGIHVCPSPRQALDFYTDAKKFVACPIKVDDLLINMDWQCPQKAKAPRVHGKCYEVDIDGKKITKKKAA